jgi:hypothetical protein
MQDNILEFNKKVSIINKDYAMYKDEEKGIMFPLNTVNLLARVDYLELSKEEYEKARFEMKIDNLEYNIIETTRPVPKNTITKKDSDKYTIVDSKVKVRQVWNVSNALGIKKSFTNKEEAMQLAENLNEETLIALK